MAASYFPRSDAGLVVWITNLLTALPAQAKALGMSPTEYKDAIDQAKAVVTAIAADEAKYADWQAAVARTADLRTEALTEIQRVIERLKTSPGYTEETGKALMAVPSKAAVVHLETYKPELRAIAHGGKVRIHWKRGALDGINVYSRKLGETAFTFLGHDSRPPYDDSRPITPGEVREYRAFGVAYDEEVGQPSDILTLALTA